MAAAGASWLQLDAFPQAVILGPRPLYVRVNGAALLDLLGAQATVLAYAAAAIGRRPPTTAPPAA